MALTIVWLHNDYRLRDNPALFHAAKSGPVIPLVVWAPDEDKAWAPGGAHRWWIHHSLNSLAVDLESNGSTLVVRRGPSLDVIRSVAKETGAEKVYWNQRYEPALRTRDLKIEAALRDAGLAVKTFQSALLHDPDEVRTNAGNPYRVFTPFFKKFKSVVDVASPIGQPSFDSSPDFPDSLSIDDLGLLPKIDWAEGIREQWSPGERAAHKRLEWFVDGAITAYDEHRNRPDMDGTSMLSPYLRYGELSARQIWTAVLNQHPDNDGAWSYLSEIGWREFSYHLLYHYPHTTEKPLNDRFASFAWSANEDHLKRWQRGTTGYPIVDAGMRQLWHIGWMHNRVRMIVASFLTKDLLIHWREGARWFWDTLVDGDLANNTQGWQWSAGSGADAQPFFRIFNPVSQGERFDSDGKYVRKWVPELSNLPDKYVHKPWEAPEDVLEDAGIRLGEDYPERIVEHSDARKRAMKVYENLPKSK